MVQKTSPTLPAAPETFRLDKWLWHARFLKSRALAAELCRSGRLRINGHAIDKPNAAIRTGDVLTIPVANSVHVVRVLAFGERRGPAAEAHGLYQEMTS